VAVQQIFSLFYSRREGMTLAEVTDLLLPIASPHRVELILLHLTTLGLVKHSRGRFIPSTEMLDLGERGLIHSNIPDTRERQVVDADSGHPLASLSLNANAGETVFLAGRHWTVVEATNSRIIVRSSGERAEGDIRFRKRATRSPFARYLPPELA
jgi:ATP-dependent Lhr-like helicase